MGKTLSKQIFILKLINALGLFVYSQLALADNTHFLSPIDLWSDSLVSTYRDDTDEIQIRIKEIHPVSNIRKYPIQELHIDFSRKLYSGSKYKGEVYGKGFDSSNLFIVKEGNWFNPYRITQKTPGKDPVTGLDYVLAFDQWEANNAFKAFSHNTDENQFTVNIEGQGKHIYEFQDYITLGRIVLSRVDDNSNIINDDEKEILNTKNISMDAKECTYKQFEIFSKWIRSYPNHEETLKRLNTHFKSFFFKVLDYSQVTEENIGNILSLQNTTAIASNQRYLPIKGLSEFASYINTQLNFGIRVFAVESLLPDGTYDWSKHEKKRTLSFNLVIINPKARLEDELIKSKNLSSVALSSGNICVLNTTERFEAFLARTTNELSELIQYQQK